MASRSKKSDVQGLRVVRGPDWFWRAADGGEGFVGTVIDTLDVNDDFQSDPRSKELKKIDHDLFSKISLVLVSVIWDCGGQGFYRIGLGGDFDLRILDNSALGVRHDVGCGVCCTGDIKGFRWLCEECDTNLCSSCYFKEKHEPSHTRFLRFETPNSDPFSVVWDKSAAKVQLNGIFVGARVKRGHDWTSGDEDIKDNYSGVGLITAPTYELEPGTIQVKWPSTNTYPYRLGAEGKIDIVLEKHASGGYYIPDHLPTLKSEPIELVSSRDEGEIKFAVGDRVVVCVDPKEFERLQGKRYGGWVEDMKKIVGREGIVRRVKRAILVDFRAARPFWINPDALARLSPMSIGQPVHVKNDAHTISSMETLLTSDIARKIAGKSGQVRRCLDDSQYVEVMIDDDETGRETYKLNLSWLELSPVHGMVNSKLEKLKVKMMTLLVEAAANGQKSVLQELFSSYKIDVNCQAERGRTALQAACQYGKVETVKWLVTERKAKIHFKDDKGRSAIHHAAKKCQPSILSFLIEELEKSGVVNIRAHLDEKDKKGLTPLQIAVMSGCKKCIRILIDKGCNVNIQDSDGDSALYNAMIIEKHKRVNYRDYEIFDLLFSKSDLTQKNKKGLNSLLLAVAVTNRRALKAILGKQGRDLIHEIEQENEVTALHLGCIVGDYLSVKLFVDYVISECIAESFLNKRMKHGLTPLLIAAAQAQYETVEYLVKNNADVTLKDEINGVNAVHLLAARLDDLKNVPKEIYENEVYKIHQDLLQKYPDVTHQYPAITLMCYLIKNGCPWKNTNYNQVRRVINDDKFRRIFLTYCPGTEVEYSSNSTLDFCMLCGNTEVGAGIIEGCNHTCTRICSDCVTQVKKCQDCGSINKAFGAGGNNMQSGMPLMSNMFTYNKSIDQPSTKPAALSIQADGQENDLREDGNNMPYSSSLPATAFPSYGHPNEDCCAS